MNQTSLRLSVVCMFAAAALAAFPCHAQEGEAAPKASSLPLSTVTNLGEYQARVPAPLTIAQQRARYEADMRMARIEQNRTLGYQPLRPQLSWSMSNNEWNHYYYQPVRYRPVWGVWNNGSRIW